MAERERVNKKMQPSRKGCGHEFTGADSRERLNQISHLVAEGDFSPLSELPPKQLQIVIQLIREKRRKKMLQLIAKVIFEDLKNRR
ncbi:hypothetical protein [Gimesia chilikensis]|uniref:Uncharacterized protein n=1 Tax=Gimesia chilikensis TaxID=2605989 RepID=A0A517PVV2_9PLAN|nr:hypothetical protein [Gimesia chilikensis]QDT23495.1 hypothetical protein HG66A1_53160 [Gimesia chilikensis]